MRTLCNDMNSGRLNMTVKGLKLQHDAETKNALESFWTLVPDAESRVRCVRRSKAYIYSSINFHFQPYVTAARLLYHPFARSLQAQV